MSLLLPTAAEQQWAIAALADLVRSDTGRAGRRARSVVGRGAAPVSAPCLGEAAQPHAARAVGDRRRAA